MPGGYRRACPAPRASDADRDRVTELLGAAVANGRLHRAEFDERVDAALAARTIDALTPLTADLIARQAAAARSRRRSPGRRPSLPPNCSPSGRSTARCAATAGGRCRTGWRCAPRGAT